VIVAFMFGWMPQKIVVHARLIELELIGFVLIERSGTEQSRVVDHRMRFAIEIFPGHRRPSFDGDRHRREHKVLDNDGIRFLSLGNLQVGRGRHQ
jgi:hypothetical protein